MKQTKEKNSPKQLQGQEERVRGSWNEKIKGKRMAANGTKTPTCDLDYAAMPWTSQKEKLVCRSKKTGNVWLGGIRGDTSARPHW